MTAQNCAGNSHRAGHPTEVSGGLSARQRRQLMGTRGAWPSQARVGTQVLAKDVVVS